MAISVVGINHKYAPLHNLEHITFRPDEVQHFLPVLSREEGIEECLILSTCNRLEIYTVSADDVPIQAILYAFLKHAKPAGIEDLWEAFYCKTEQDAIEHLFSVISGLDSLVLGENEITGQVKTAYRMACDCKTNGMLLNKLCHAAFRTAKRARTETKINAGNCSVGVVAVDLAQDVWPDLSNCRALVVGAGEISRVAAKTLADRKTQQIIITNRTLPKAVALAEEVGGSAIPLEEMLNYINQVDIIISGTGSSEYVFRYEDMQRVLANSPHRIVMVDIALPRDVDPQIGTLPGVALHNLYDLKAIVDRNVQQRQQEIPAVRRIVEEEVEKFLAWKQTLKVSATIQTLHRHFETLRTQELSRYQHQLSAEQYAQLDSVTQSLTNKYIHVIISNLKSLNEVCELNAQHIHIIQNLFDCEGMPNVRTCCRFKREHACARPDAACYRPTPCDRSVAAA